MTRAEVVRLLALIASLDGRRVDDLTVEAWLRVLQRAPRVTAATAMQAVEAHYVRETHRIMPADIIKAVDPFAGTRWGRQLDEMDGLTGDGPGAIEQ